MEFLGGIIVGLVVGGLAVLVWRRSQGEEAAALRVQVQERDAQIGELKADVARRDESLRQANEARAAAETQCARAETQLDAARRDAQEKLALISDARAALEQNFKALAHDTLRANSESFLNSARSLLQSLLSGEQAGMEKRREAIEKLLAPISESLKRAEESLRVVEKERGVAYAALNEQVLKVNETQERLRQETAGLVTALRYQPHTRGRWGELTLRRTVELAGMCERCDFTEQVSVNTEEGRLRPDMVVHLPAQRDIVVDAKVSLKAFLDALDAPTDDEREKCMERHAAQVRAHVDRLASKDYSRQFEKAPEFVVLFLPGETFFSAALQRDAQLYEDAMSRGVIIATPATLVAVLLAVAHGWRQASLEENARRISAEARELYDRLARVCEYLTEVGPAIKRAMDTYNRAVGSFNARLLPHARKLRELGATSAAEVSDIPPAEGQPRALDMPQT